MVYLKDQEQNRRQEAPPNYFLNLEKINFKNQDQIYPTLDTFQNIGVVRIEIRQLFFRGVVVGFYLFPNSYVQKFQESHGQFFVFYSQKCPQ